MAICRRIFQRQTGGFSYAGKATPLIPVLFALPSVAHKFPKTSSVGLAQGPERDEFARKSRPPDQRPQPQLIAINPIWSKL
jgi:hypothetical protein